MNKQSECGLMLRHTEGADEFRTVPLTGVRLHATVKGACSRVTVVQSYENREDIALEAVYVFPLEEGSAVCGFSVKIGDRRIVGKVLPRDEAFDRYDEGMAEGHGAFLLDQERPNIFTASVGNILPKQKVDVEISYVAELAREQDAIRLMIPTTVSPRYVPESRRDFQGTTDGERVNPPVSLGGTPYALDLKVEADLLSPIRTIESPSHKIRTEIDGARAVITLAGDEGALDRDLVLLLRAREPQKPTLYQTLDDNGDRFVLASFVPDIPVERKPVEVVFLVDCSGSMHGPSIEEARRTLLLCLQSLAMGDRFNIVRFGSTHERLFKKSVKYDDKKLEKGKAWVKSMNADLGGTEILTPLEEILGESGKSGLPRRVVLLTDGEVSNEEEVISLARSHRRTTRIFAFGIGAGPSEFLIRGLARASRGAAEFVYPGERIENKVLRHFDRITMGGAADLAMTWEGLEVEQITPADPPALAPGEFVTFIGKLVAGTEGKAVLTYKVDDRECRLESDLKEPVEEENQSLLSIMWARRRIRELEEGDRWIGRRGSRQTDRARKKVERELIELATSYGLMSSTTSYVAIEERSPEDQAKERAELRRIPVALSHGWGGVHEGAHRHITGAIRSMDSVMACESPDVLRMTVQRWGNGGSDIDAAAAPGDAAPSDPMDRVLFEQRADGSWKLTRELAEMCGSTLKDLKNAARALQQKDANPLLATLLMLVLLDSRSDAASLKPVIRKAREWVDSATAGLAPPDPYSSWQVWAEQFVETPKSSQ